MSSDYNRHVHRPRGESKSSRHGSSNSDRTGTGVVMRPSGLSAKPPTGLSSSPRQSRGSTGRPPQRSSLNQAGENFRPRDGSTGSRSSDGAPVGAVSMRPSGGRQKASTSGGNDSNRGSNSASLQDVDLNLSQSSDQSVVTLGGVEYPIGSRIGKSKMFVIGDPAGFPRHDTSMQSYRSSAPSTMGSHAPMYRGDGKGYNFEYWPWNIIRFVCFIFILLLMVGLLAGVITVGVRHKKQCEAHFLWWQGATSYNIPVPYFHDSDNSNIGDLIGIEKKLSYFEYMGYESVILQDFLWSEQEDWELVNSFTDVDPRLGTNDEFRRMVDILNDRGVKVILQMCPWYTSKDHSWYIESRENSFLSVSNYRDFYIWVDAPDPNAETKWEFDTIRNQWYMYLDDPAKPLLDWTNTKVTDAFVGIFEFWLQMGVDGFAICGLKNFHVERMEIEINTILSRFHETLSDYSEMSQKILIVDSDYVNMMAATSKAVLDLTLERVDLIKTPMTLIPDNKTLGLQNLIKGQLEFQNQTDAWLLWSPTDLKDLPSLYTGALQLLDFFIPGTPGLTAGQEIGQYFLEIDERYQAPMLWEAESPLPYNPGGPLPAHNIEGLHNISRKRQSTFSLRLDRVPTEEDKGLTVRFLEVDPEKDFMLLSRFYPSDNTYYYAANFGNRALQKDFAETITPWATVLADSMNKYRGRLELEEVNLDPGQAIVFYPTK